MATIVEVEAIATPAHTRGSITYVLRPVLGQVSSGVAYLFTGDTMFSGGGGVPFEADIDINQDSKTSKMTGNTFIKASASTYAVERCFAEIIYRSNRQEGFQDISSDRLLVFPGHEYTTELLNRQLPGQETNRWKNASPAVFFETMSHYYATIQRRSLPQTSGKLLCAPTSIRSEILINPHLRSLKIRGEAVLNALKMWNRNWAIEKVSGDVYGAFGVNDTRIGSIKLSKTIEKTPSTASQWNLNADTINKQVFTTVYSADLDSIIDDLRSGRVDSNTAAARLSQLKANLHSNVVLRRPIPGTLPSDKNIYKALVGFALLSSSPTGLTLKDSTIMKLNPPINTSSDEIRLSKRRLVTVLYLLGLLDEEHSGNLIVAIIQNLWKEALDYNAKSSDYKDFDSQDQNCNARHIDINMRISSPSHTEIESSLNTESDDEIFLGSLKWIIYGIPEQTQSRFQFCLPCFRPEMPTIPSPLHPAGKSEWKVHTGELVRHDIQVCKLSQSATGYDVLDNSAIHETSELIVVETDRQTILDYGSTESEGDKDNESTFFEVAPIEIGHIVREV
jgi:hypothetical protein